jgi:hypothetical protein
MSERETEDEVGKVGPRQWVPKEELLRLLRDLPPDPTLLDDIRELGGTLDELRDPWER